MYPSAPHDHERYTADGHPAPVPAAGFLGHNHREPYIPPYNIPTRTASHGLAVPWTSGLCHCCDHPTNCLITSCCPCITFAQIAEIVNKGSSTCGYTARGALYTRAAFYGVLLFTGLSCLYSCFYRSKLRAQYDLEEAPCVDCLVHCCCEPCALCQEYRELNNRGFDMGIGWEANMERQKRGNTIAPVVTQGMTR